jgi:hypothetical protein
MFAELLVHPDERPIIRVTYANILTDVNGVELPNDGSHFVAVLTD